MQRLAYYLFGITCLIIFFHNPKKLGRRIYHGLLIVFAAFGVFIAGRQVWLQHLPANQIPACAPDLKFMLQSFPLHQVLKVLFYGSGDCSLVKWKFLGLAMADWSLIFLLGLLIVALRLFFKNKS